MAIEMAKVTIEMSKKTENTKNFKKYIHLHMFLPATLKMLALAQTGSQCGLFPTVKRPKF